MLLVFHNHDTNVDHLKMVMRAIMTMQWYSDCDDDMNDDNSGFNMIMKVMMMMTSKDLVARDQVCNPRLS